MKCPCNPNKLYKNCCKKTHDNIFSAETSEELMRSRYSAFVLGNINYLHKSHHSTTRLSNREYKELKKWTQSVDWVKLQIHNSTDNSVEFTAFFIENGSLETIKEHSIFCIENNHWVYLNAV